jgi:hypothetical protein
MKQEEQLRLLSIFHYVVAGLSALFACFPIIHLTLGLFMVFAPETFHNKGDNAPPAFIGWFFVIFAAMFILIGWTFAAFIFTAGRFLAKRKHYMFCLVMAAANGLRQCEPIIWHRARWPCANTLKLLADFVAEVTVDV